MSQKNVYSQQLASYQTASTNVQKTRQLVMLYDAVIRFLKQARNAMEQGDFEGRFNYLVKCGNIISGLHGSLDFEKGGEISHMLNNFYFAIDLRMMDLNRTNSTKDCDGIIEEVKMMRDAWDKIDHELSLPIGMPKEEVKSEQNSEKTSADFSA